MVHLLLLSDLRLSITLVDWLLSIKNCDEHMSDPLFGMFIFYLL